AALSDRHHEYSTGVVFSSKKSQPSDDQAFEVRGNLRDKVWANYKLSLYLRSYKEIADIFPKGEIYNLSDGAYIEGLAPLPVQDIELTKLAELNKGKILAQWKAKPRNNHGPTEIKESIAVTDELLARIRAHAGALEAHPLQANTIDELIETRSERFLAEFSTVCAQNPDLSGIIRSYLFSVDYQVLQMLDNRNLSGFTSHARRLYSLWLDGLTEIIERCRAELIRQRESYAPEP
ncbi:MAG: hypothetical protein V3S33_07970, partial [Gammaproteobacteria bacterium]